MFDGQKRVAQGCYVVELRSTEVRGKSLFAALGKCMLDFLLFFNIP